MDWTLPVSKILLTSILFIVLSGVCFLLIARIQRTLAVRQPREHIVKLSNQGNFTSIFALSVVSAEKTFSFKFLLNDIPLISIPQAEIVPELPSVSASTPSVSSPLNKPENTGPKAGSNVKGILKGGQFVAAKSGQAAAFLGTLASLLPGSLGSGLRAQSETLRQTQANATAATQAPGRAQRKVESLQQQSGRLVAPSAAAGRPQDVKRPANQAVPSQAAGSPSADGRKVVPGSCMVRTQPVEPGGSLSLTLRVEASKGSRPAGTYAYTLSSQQLPVDNLDGAELPVTMQGILHFPHVDFWRYWLAPAASFLVIAILMLALVFALRFVW